MGDRPHFRRRPAWRLIHGHAIGRSGLAAFRPANRRAVAFRRMVKLLGIDPGLRFTGWGIIEAEGNRLRHVADGIIATDAEQSVPERLRALHEALGELLGSFHPDEAAVEETYVNRNGTATLKLGYARGVALLAPALAGIPVIEYGAKAVKSAVVGTGGADKAQVAMMVRRLLPGATIKRADAADALAVAICHAHHRASKSAWARAERIA
jgi:crossover junction endodeoxyribonuclease RuvC